MSLFQDIRKLGGKVTKITLTQEAFDELTSDLKGLYAPERPVPELSNGCVSRLIGIDFFIEKVA